MKTHDTHGASIFSSQTKKQSFSSKTGKKVLLSSFVAVNVECQYFGSFRVPKAFQIKYCENLPSCLWFKCKSFIWKGKYDAKQNKIDLCQFTIFNGIKLFNLVQFDYYGDGIFNVKIYKETAIECKYPSIDQYEFMKIESTKIQREKQYLFDGQSLEYQKSIALLTFNGFRNHLDYTQIEIIEFHIDPQILNLMLKPNMERFFRKWEHGSSVFLRFVERTWEIKIEWKDDMCTFGKGWYDFARETKLAVSDTLVMYTISNVENMLNVCIFKGEDYIDDVEERSTVCDRSFFKVVSQTSLKLGLFVVPKLVNDKYKQKLNQMNQLEVAGERWFIFYNANGGYVHNLQEMMKHFNLQEKETIFFSMDDSNIMYARIYQEDGMEIEYKKRCQSNINPLCTNWFWHADWPTDSEVEEEEKCLENDNAEIDAVVNGELREFNNSPELLAGDRTTSPESHSPTTNTMNSGESINSGAAELEIDEFRALIEENERENEEIENEFGDLNSQEGDEDEEEAELSPKLAEGFYEIESVRRKRVRKGQVQYLIKWRGWAETANTWEPYANLVSCFDVIEAFEEGLRSGKHRSRKRKRRSSGLVPQAKKKMTQGASTSSPRTAGRVKFDEGNFIIPFVGDVSHEDGGSTGTGGTGNDDAIEQGNGNVNGSVAYPPQVEEEKGGYEKDVNVGESTGTQLTNGGSSLLGINNLESQICFENGQQNLHGEGLVQANARFRKKRKAASVKRFSQEQTQQTERVTNHAEIEQGNVNESVDIPPQVEEGRDHYEMDVNHGEYAGTPLINWGSSRVAVDILESKTSEAVSFENGHQNGDGEGLVQANGRLRNRRKPASVKRFSLEQTSHVTNYAAIEQDNGNGNVFVHMSPQVEEGRDHYEMDVNPGQYAGTSFINGGFSRVAVDILESKSSEAICFENGHQSVNKEGLVQANGHLRNKRKPASVIRFSQEKIPRVTNDAAIEQGIGNGNESFDMPPQLEEGRVHYELDVNPGEYAGTPFMNGGSSRVAVDILESETSEAVCLDNGHQKLDGEGLVQGNGRLKNRRKAASVKRFNQEQTPCVTNYAAQDLTTKNTRACGISGQNWDKNSVHRSKSDNSTDILSITEIIKPMTFSSPGSVSDILVTFLAKRSDGKEVMVDNKYLKANCPLLLINYYEQHLNYNATAGPDRSGREYMAG